ncbi:MAG: endonuclease/exonuclease/phosphatase family protein [Bacteroidales bacterium]
MPVYSHIKQIQDPVEKERTINGLLNLKAGLKSIPKKNIDENLIIATWNIREFDSPAYGDRSQEAMAYIAEIINRFDLVAVQEVRDDLKALNSLMKILGKSWDCIFTDTTEGSHGNGERLAFLYDRRKLSFSGLAGEIVIPPIEEKEGKSNTIYKPAEQLYRTPFVVGFHAGWLKFMISTAHIVYGENKEDSPERIKEISLLSDFLAARIENKTALYKNLILLGDFNIFNPKNKTFKEISKNFTVPEELQALPSNAMKNKHYDQIAFKFTETVKIRNAGVFDFYNHVYKVEDELKYVENMGTAYLKTSAGKTRTAASKTDYYKTYWRTYQLSDHLPMWIEFETDFSEDYLKTILK